jgi:hypothetical protein
MASSHPILRPTLRGRWIGMETHSKNYGRIPLPSAANGIVDAG